MGKSSAVLTMAAGAASWSLGGVLIKWIDLPPLAIAGWRGLISGFTIWLLMGRPRVTLAWLNLAAACAYCGMVICFVVATKWTTAANAIMLQFTAPIYVALLGPRLLNEPTRWWDWCTIFLGLIGMLLFFMDTLSPQGAWGNLVALGSGVSMAALFIIMRRQKDAAPAHGVILGNWLTALVCLPVMLGSAPGGQDWAGLLLLGIMQLGLGYYLFIRAISHISAVESVLICLVEPILNPVWVWLVLGEAPAPFAALGGLLVLLAATFRGVVAARHKA